MNIYCKHIGRFFTVILLTWACNRQPDQLMTDQEVTLVWAGMSLEITINTPANSPTYASRCFGYIGLVMYESIVNGFPEYTSLAGQLNGLTQLPKPDSTMKYNWILALNAAQASILKYIGKTAISFIQKKDIILHPTRNVEIFKTIIIQVKYTGPSSKHTFKNNKLVMNACLFSDINKWGLTDQYGLKPKYSIQTARNFFKGTGWK